MARDLSLSMQNMMNFIKNYLSSIKELYKKFNKLQTLLNCENIKQTSNIGSKNIFDLKFK